jgi:uncharacterized protein (TIGR03435 family)
VDLFDIQAVIPEGTPFETREQRGNGDAPGLRRMLQSLLAERFKLAVHRESREAPVYALTVARDAAKFADPNGATVWLTGNTEQTGDMLLGGALRDPGVIGDTGVRNGEVMQVFRGRNASVANLATSLGPAMGRPVLDRTGLTGRFNFDFWVAPLEFGVLTTLFRSTPRASTPSIFAVLDEVGLTLAPTRAPLEMLVIDRVEGPTEN